MEDMKKFSMIKIWAGCGCGAFPMELGCFDYSEEILWKHHLDIQLIQEYEDKWIFQLTDSITGKKGKMLCRKSGKEIKIHFDLEEMDCNRLWIQCPISSTEHFYGCGETFSAFDLKNEKVRIWVAEHQNIQRIKKKLSNSEKKAKALTEYDTYCSIPIIITGSKTMIYVETNTYMEFDLHNPAEIYVWGTPDITALKADTFEELSEKTADKFGHSADLPDWIYDGAILAVQRGTDEVERVLKEAENNNIPVTGVWCQDWCGCRKTDFGYQVFWNWEYNEHLYPDLRNKIKEWKKKGVRFLGYINPFLALEGSLYKYAEENGYCVRNKNGEIYLVTITTFPAAMVDFTNPKAWDWYKKIIKKNLIDLGAGGWMADFGEYLPTDAVLYSGESAFDVHNRWSALWARLNKEAIIEADAQDDIFFFTRAAHTGSIGQTAMMWNGDQHVDWSEDDGIGSVIPAALSLSVTGLGLSHSDTGGYTTFAPIMQRDEELLLRWEELNAFTPLLRFHEGNRPDANIQFDGSERLLSHLSCMANIHVGLKQYIKCTIHENAEKGIPVIRPLFYYYEDEEWTFEEKEICLLGRDILLAPVLKPDTYIHRVHLPNDNWVHIFTGKEYIGGVYDIEAPIGTPAVFIRKNSGWASSVLKTIKDTLK